MRHGLAEMIRYRALLIAAGYPDGNDCDALRSDPAFKMAVGRLPESGADLCSQPTISRLENLPGPTALKRMMAAMVDLFCDSFDQVPRRIVLDIDDTEDRVHGGQQLALFNAHYDSRCFLPIHIYEAASGKPVAVILRPGKTPDGAEVALVLRHVVGHIRARWPAVDIVVRGDSHYGRPEAMAWCERNRVGYVFGLAGNPVLLRQVAQLAEDAALGRVAGEATRSAATATSATPPRAGTSSAASSPASRPGRRAPTAASSSPISPGAPRWLYEKVYCARGQAENLIKAHKLHLASDRTSCSQGDGQPVPPADPHRRLLAAAEPARPGAPDLVLARRAVRHDPALPDQGRRPRHRDGHPRSRSPCRPPTPTGKPGAARRPRRQAAAVTDGAACPRPSPFPPKPQPTATVAQSCARPRHRSPRRKSWPQNTDGKPRE